MQIQKGLLIFKICNFLVPTMQSVEWNTKFFEQVLIQRSKLKFTSADFIHMALFLFILPLQKKKPEFYLDKLNIPSKSIV